MRNEGNDMKHSCNDVTPSHNSTYRVGQIK